MTDDLVYLIGPPAVGKSTLMRELTRGCQREAEAKPFAHDWLYDPAERGVQLTRLGIELGRRRADFPGTDTLAMNVAPVARQWIATRPNPLILAEGDRLANMAFLLAAQAVGYVVNVVYLHAEPDVLDARSQQRGSAQNAAWRKGRTTKSSNLTTASRTEGLKVFTLDSGFLSPVGCAMRLRSWIPALRKLPESSSVTAP